MTANEPIVGIHLDLKYLMPRKDYLITWVKRLPGLGINTLLLEYEDKFPYQKYPFIQADGAFTPAELRAFLDAAHGAGLQVVPLVQTIAHLEFALFHDQLARFREAPTVLNQIDTSNPEAVRFVFDLIDEVLAYHEKDRYIHLGADEAWHLGHNPRTAKLLAESGPEGVWIGHMKKVLQHVIDAGKRPMVWDDIFWKDPARVAQSGLPRETILVSWAYTVTPETLRAKPAALDRVKPYRAAGYDWIAAPCYEWGELVPEYDHCLKNTLAWVQTGRAHGMMGLLNTGWASFFTIPPVETFHVAATAKAMQSPEKLFDNAWQVEFFRQEFGAPADDVPAALRDLGTKWEHDAGLERPVSPITMNVMETVIYYHGMEQRKLHGACYPLDWDEVDFSQIYRVKIDMLRTKKDTVRAKLDDLEPKYDRARAVLGRLAGAATVRQDEARLLSLYADLKSSHARIVRWLVLGEGDPTARLREHAALKPRLIRCLTPFLEPVSVGRLVKLWYEPVHHVLAWERLARRAPAMKDAGANVEFG